MYTLKNRISLLRNRPPRNQSLYPDFGVVVEDMHILLYSYKNNPDVLHSKHTLLLNIWVFVLYIKQSINWNKTALFQYNQCKDVFENVSMENILVFREEIMLHENLSMLTYSVN